MILQKTRLADRAVLRPQPIPLHTRKAPPSPSTQTSAIGSFQRATYPSRLALRPGDVLNLQKVAGNRALQRLLTSYERAKLAREISTHRIRDGLAINLPNDIYEQEANSVAKQVTGRAERVVDRMNVSSFGKLSASHAYPQSIIESAISGKDAKSDLHVSSSNGQPLPDRDLATMEKAFDADFSGVRVHNNQTADKLNRSLRTRAFTIGSDIFFRKADYNPHTTDGRELIAHELTHVLQQSGEREHARRHGSHQRDSTLLKVAGYAEDMHRKALVRASRPSRPVEIKHFQPNSESIQGKPVYNEDTRCWIDDKTGNIYELMKTIDYGDEKRAYQLWDRESDKVVLVDAATMQVVDQSLPAPYEHGLQSHGHSSQFPLPGPPTPGFAPSAPKQLPENPPFFTTTPSTFETLPSSPVSTTTELGGSSTTQTIGEKRKLHENESGASDSEFSASEDDEKTTLTEEQRLELMAKKGAKKQKKLKELTVSSTGGAFKLSDPRARKIYAAHRTSNEPERMSNLNQPENFTIGPQKIRIREGTGYFIQSGGNKRPENIKEPPADYQELFVQMKRMGNDASAGRLYNLATGKDLGNKVELDDAELAAMALYYMNNEADEIHKELKRTQLTEHLAKLTAITGISEFSRAMEAKWEGKPSPYDATLLVKGTLRSVMEGQHTLQEGFYKGTGGTESVFIGAPNAQKAPDKVGGAEVLRNPFAPKSQSKLKRQMGIFPANKGEFKKRLNELRSRTKVKAPEITDEIRKQMADKAKQEEVDGANGLLTKIQNISVPTDPKSIGTFLTSSDPGSFQAYSAELNKLKKRVKGNDDALKIIDTAQKALKDKHKKAASNLAINISSKRNVKSPKYA